MDKQLLEGVWIVLPLPQYAVDEAAYEAMHAFRGQCVRMLAAHALAERASAGFAVSAGGTLAGQPLASIASGAGEVGAVKVDFFHGLAHSCARTADGRQDPTRRVPGTESVWAAAYRCIERKKIRGRPSTLWSSDERFGNEGRISVQVPAGDLAQAVRVLVARVLAHEPFAPKPAGPATGPSAEAAIGAGVQPAPQRKAFRLYTTRTGVTSAQAAFESVIDELVSQFPSVFGHDRGAFTLTEGERLGSGNGETEFALTVQTAVDMTAQPAGSEHGELQIEDVATIEPADPDSDHG